mgnify:CR=1 FL=1
MSNSELRNNLHGFIDNVKDEKFLRVVHAMMKEYLENSDITEEEKKKLNFLSIFLQPIDFFASFVKIYLN